MHRLTCVSSVKRSIPVLVSRVCSLLPFAAVPVAGSAPPDANVTVPAAVVVAPPSGASSSWAPTGSSSAFLFFDSLGMAGADMAVPATGGRVEGEREMRKGERERKVGDGRNTWGLFDFLRGDANVI